MKFFQSSLLIATLAGLANVISAKDCGYTVWNSKVKMSGDSLRLRGHYSSTNSDCKSYTNNADTSITFHSNDDVSFSVNGRSHYGSKCTVNLSKWFDKHKDYDHDDGKRELYLPLWAFSSVSCNKDSGKTTAKYQRTTSTRKTTTTTRRTSTSTRKTTTTTRRTSTSTRKTTTTTRKTTTTTRKTTTTTRKTTTTKKTTTTRKSTTTTRKTTTIAASPQSGSSYSGKATWFHPNQGACGDWNTIYDDIAALSSSFYGSFSKKSPYCDRKMKVTNTDNGKSVTVTVKDGCPPCDSNHVDLSIGAFEKIGDLDKGVLKISFYFL